MLIAGPIPFICRKCLLSSRRHLSSAAKLPPPATGFAHLENRALISIHGRDSAHFLQGLSTNSIKTTSPSPRGFFSAFLNAQGRVLHDVFIYPADHSPGYRESVGGEMYEGPGFIIDVDRAHAEILRAHLRKFKLRAKINLRILDPGEWDVWGAWGGGDMAQDDSLAEAQDIGCVDPRAPGMGRRLVVHRGTRPQFEGEELPVMSYDVRRIMMGVPQGHQEILSGEALPQESDIDYMGGIDFRKGCYVGQELTIRTHHTGIVRKRILPVQLYELDEKAPESLQYDPTTSLSTPTSTQNISRVNTRGRSAGKWLTGVGNIGLALCRLETMTNTRLTEEGSQWSPDHEFKMAWQPEEERQGGELKIKAFVPQWHRNQISLRDMHRQQKT